jgi:hypothetical protein
MKALILILLLSSGFVPYTEVSRAQATGDSTEAITKAIAMLENAPTFDGNAFCCDSIVQAVNGLRRLGKENALKALRLYLGKYDTHAPDPSEKVLIICRLLFVNPESWKQPRLGHPSPETSRHVTNKNPLFPLILSQGIPFLLITGYEGSGYTDDTGDKCVHLCEGFKLITRALPENGYEDAARALVKSEEFETLYVDTNVLIHVEKMIFAQAQCPDPLIRKGGNVESSIEVKMWSVPQTNSARKN